ncbi:MAG: CopG family antitoxin [bacterium]
MKKSKNKMKLPENFDSPEMASDFWDNQSVSDHLADTQEAEFEVEIKKEPRYVAIESGLSIQVTKISRQRGISPETLVNLWIKEKISAK